MSKKLEITLLLVSAVNTFFRLYDHVRKLVIVYIELEPHMHVH